MRRKVIQTVTGNVQKDGAGVKLVRVLGPRTIKSFDPSLMMDFFDSENPEDYTKGFPWHTHRGIETITYLIHGEIEHQDSLGNKGVIKDGCCQWMTAGSGIIHQEMPVAVPRLLGAQLWLNLPKDCKMAEPAYRDITSEMVPEVEEDGATVRVISGHYKGTKGAVQGGYTKMQYLDVALGPDTEWILPTEHDETVFVYIVAGNATFCEGERCHLDRPEKDQTYSSKPAVLFDKGDELCVCTCSAGTRLHVLSGEPLGGPVAWGGPIVMNTEAELNQAFKELENDTFIKHK